MCAFPAGVDPRTPVIVGAGRLGRRPTGADDLTDPVGFAAEALEQAAADSGSGRRLLDRVQSLCCVRPWSWAGSGDPAGAVAAHLGLQPAETVLAHHGGDTPQLLLTDSCRRIGAGRLDVAAITGAEIILSQGVATVAGLPAPGGELVGLPSRRVGSDRYGYSEVEADRGFVLPVELYALLETALARRDGLDGEAATARAARLWAGMSEVAATNPHAWLPTARTAAELAAPDTGNRMVASPYRKLMTANIRVEQAGALLVVSAEAAAAAGVPPDRWVFPTLAADGHDVWHVSERAELTGSPALRRARDLVGPVDHVDLYSCFPSAVRIAAESLQLLDERGEPQCPLTVTGGLTFAGGPGNNYVTHSLAAMVGRLRASGGRGLVTGVGYYLTKHAVTVLAAQPPVEPFDHHDLTAPDPTVRVERDYAGAAGIETATVVHDREGEPESARLLLSTPAGSRVLGTTSDTGLLPGLVAGDGLGARVQVERDGTVHA